MKKIIPIIIIVLIVIIIAISCGSGDDEEKATNTDTNTTTTEEATEPDKPEMTMAQENSYGSAKDYIDNGAFSKQGLLQQLTSEYGEGYEKKDARFAIKLLEKNREVNWKEEAAESAREYLDNGAFSKQGLLQQLTSDSGEGFTEKQARYAIKLIEKNGEVNWKEEAVESAREYLDNDSFSKQGLFEQLTSEYGEGFTEKQARYAVEKVYK